MGNGIQETPRAGMGIHELVVEAHQEVRKDRRAETRYPFFRQIMLMVTGKVPTHAFTREISSVGVGLLHDVPLVPGEVELSIPSKKGYSIRVRTKILWCSPCGEGWYISGGQFVGTAFVEQ
ncbi:MAG: hypothetical protein DWQ37_16175 [Planctomycetota bacterium]|nr:MAG: hypothetical protein DWQ37_16175 [Planctomycetota bacterium]